MSVQTTQLAQNPFGTFKVDVAAQTRTAASAHRFRLRLLTRELQPSLGQAGLEHLILPNLGAMTRTNLGRRRKQHYEGVDRIGWLCSTGTVAAGGTFVAGGTATPGLLFEFLGMFVVCQCKRFWGARCS